MGDTGRQSWILGESWMKSEGEGEMERAGTTLAAGRLAQAARWRNEGGRREIEDEGVTEMPSAELGGTKREHDVNTDDLVQTFLKQVVGMLKQLPVLKA